MYLLSMLWIRLAAALGFLGVALGAFGAHALRARLAPDLLAIWQTGVLYHLIHSVTLLVLALRARESAPPFRWSMSAFTLGILLFSGSLYALCLTGQKAFGAVTPLGGAAFLAGWGGIFFGTDRRG